MFKICSRRTERGDHREEPNMKLKNLFAAASTAALLGTSAMAADIAVIAGSIVLERIVRVALARAIRSKPVTGQALALHGHG